MWSNVHPDFDNAEETTNVYFDGLGQGALMLTGELWTASMVTLPSHRPLPLEKFICCGVRDQFEDQMRKLESSLAGVVERSSNSFFVRNLTRRPVGLTIASFDPHLEGGDATANVAVIAIARLVSKL